MITLLQIPVECADERIMKISRYLSQFLTKKICLGVLITQCYKHENTFSNKLPIM